MRDDFPQSVKDKLARRVGWRCSNPNCRRLTCGPHTKPDKAVSIGVAAHITAASPGGPRYDAPLTSEERRSIENGIWLCQDCAKLIDSDEERFPVETLRAWKTQAEADVRRQIEGGLSPKAIGSSQLVEKIDTLIIASQQNSEQFDNLKIALQDYVNRLIEHMTPQSLPSVAANVVEMIPLDTGYWIHPKDVAAEGTCQCDRDVCV